MNTYSFSRRIPSLFSLISCILLIVVTPVFGGSSKSVKLGWAPNQESDLAGYRVYHGTVSGQYSRSTDIGLNETYATPDLDPNKTHYFAITAYDTVGNESIPTPEVYKKFLPGFIPLTINLQGSGIVRSNSGGVTCSSGSCTTAMTTSTKVTLTATPNSGSAFSGWSGACSGTGSCVVVLDAAQHVTAKFTPIPTVLTMQVTGQGRVVSVTNKGDFICPRSTCTVDMSYGTKATLTATPNSGSAFSGWSGACSGIGSCVVVLDAAQHVTAKFTPIPTVLTMQVTGQGRVNGVTNEGDIVCPQNTCTVDMSYGTKATLTATPNSGSAFSGWSGACSGTGSCAVVLKAPQQVVATFNLVKSLSAISDPTPGATLTESSVIFTGGHTSGDVAHSLWVGTTQGGRNVFVGPISNRRQRVSGLPSQGTIYVRYWSLRSKDSSNANAWSFTDQVYMMAVDSSDKSDLTDDSENFPPSLSSPAPGTTLTRTSVTFTGGHTSADVMHSLWVGTTKGSRNVFSGGISNHMQRVSGLPSRGTIYVRYWTLKGKDSSKSAAWSFKDHVYNMAVGGNDGNFPPSLSSPAPGTTLTRTSVTFTGGHTSADVMHSLWVGTTKGSRNVFGGRISNHMQRVSGLPSRGTIYVRYWTLKGKDSSNSAAWSFKDHAYIMNVGGN